MDTIYYWYFMVQIKGGTFVERMTYLFKALFCYLRKDEIDMKDFNPQLEIFDPFVVPFSNPKKADVVFDQREMDACCACTACSACSACK